METIRTTATVERGLVKITGTCEHCRKRVETSAKIEDGVVVGRFYWAHTGSGSMQCATGRTS